MELKMAAFDLTPDPKVLVALTHTPMSPLDALCELIDNSLDSFRASKVKGSPISSPLVIVALPKIADLDREEGILRVRDNGPGMSAEQAEKALRAGFSGNNPYDSLGLFGMGFNISTGKLGRRTKFVTARHGENFALEVIIDLDKIITSRSYSVPVTKIEKPQNFDHGTLVEVSNWWPDGSPNAKFVRKLVQYGIPVIQREIGHRYATILRGDLRKKGVEARISVNDTECIAFEHCIWDDKRHVNHRSFDKIPAVIRFDEVAGTQVRCLECAGLVDAGKSVCGNCGSGSLRTLEQKVRGWLGIQRFDDAQKFGIDVIRNGRAIRVAEKAAFFEFVDEFKNTIKDYPVDQQFGRIVGEVHLDHVPVDFLKQDFQRTSIEWADAMKILRGESSLQPKQPNAESNNSPMFKLYQGYRRVRDFGKRDMYMGYWDQSKSSAVRISREIEQDYYKRFQAKEPGFYDDSEWWKLIENADNKPLDDLLDCPNCGSQNLSSAISCSICDEVLIGKNCVNSECKTRLPANAKECPKCGTSQIIEVKHPWACKVCNNRNAPGLAECSQCANPMGTPNPFDENELLVVSNRDDALSIDACSVRLADGNNSDPLDIETYVTSNSILPWGKFEKVPVHVVAHAAKVRIFLDRNHPTFSEFGLSPEQMIADQVASIIHRSNGRLTGSHVDTHTVPIISWSILQTRWGNSLNSSAEKTRTDALEFFESVRDRMHSNMTSIASELYDELQDNDRRGLVERLLEERIDPAKLSAMKTDGSYMRFLKTESVVYLISRRPEAFLDGNVWDWSTKVSDQVSVTCSPELTSFES
jgi:Histidine kinase-, DNA gyrase B-, and HSP90-like ATPase